MEFYDLSKEQKVNIESPSNTVNKRFMSFDSLSGMQEVRSVAKDIAEFIHSEFAKINIGKNDDHHLEIRP